MPLPESGHINPSLKLARGLQEHGHRVIYCGIRDLEETVRAEGFEFECLLEEVFPRGFQTEVKARAAHLRGLHRLRFMRELVQQETRMFECLLRGEVDRLIEQLRPDLVICDAMLPEPALVCHGHRVPCLILHTSIPHQCGPLQPPLSSSMIPGKGLGKRARISWEWFRLILKMKVSGTMLRWVGLEPAYHRYRLELARKHGYPPEGLDFTGSLNGVRSPMLVLCPRDFSEFREAKPAVEYIHTGPCIDLVRQETMFPWERLSEDKPLILCSLGTMEIHPDRAKRFQRAILGTARQRPQWQFVVATNRWEHLQDGMQSLPNVVAVARVPQLKLLQRAAAMVTHGGFNSVKECLYFGVPLVVVPVQFDQHGIAARVVHHGLGVRSDIDKLTQEQLLVQLSQVMEDPAHRLALERMKALFREAEQEADPARLVSRYLSDEGRPGERRGA
ncbi:glycosyltransferase [Pyxidicoccus sp. 3LFB2]